MSKYVFMVSIAINVKPSEFTERFRSEQNNLLRSASSFISWRLRRLAATHHLALRRYKGNAGEVNER